MGPDRLEEARGKLPLRSLIGQYGHGPADGKWKSFPECPFCHQHRAAGVFTRGGRDYFKCFHADCRTGGQALDEVGYVGAVSEVNRRDAYVAYLKMAGVWREERLGPSVMPGTRARRRALPTPAEDESHAASEENVPRGTVEESGESESAAEGVGTDALASGAEDAPEAAAAPESPCVDQTPQTDCEAGAADDLQASEPAVLRSPEQPMEGPVPPGDEPNPMPVSPPVTGADDAGQLAAGIGPSEEETDREDQADRTEGTEGTEGTGQAEQTDRTEGTGPAPSGDEDEQAGEWVQAQAALQAFYGTLSLSDTDRRSLRERRGLTDEVIEACGFRSSSRDSEVVLQGLEATFGVPALLKAGLWITPPEGREGAPRPNPQFFGRGISGKDAKGRPVRDWTMPILIPYWALGGGAPGRIEGLRPHKDNVVGAPPHLWAVPLPAGSKRQRAVITEGEFKAAALQAVVGGEYAAAALPGISMGKHWLVQRELKQWLETLGVRSVVVAFDNEEKGDPRLPGYKADRRKRFDAEVWSRYLAQWLAKEGWEATVAHLPDAWRDARGKADWDGALASLRGQRVCWAEIRRKFREVLRGGLTAAELRQDGLFDGATEQLIRAGVQRIFYVPRLPVGGMKEAKEAARLKRYVEEHKQSKVVAFLNAVENFAQAYRKLEGCYYNHKPTHESLRKMAGKALAEGMAAKDWATVQVAQTLMKGLPNLVSDFCIEPQFSCNNLDGTRSRMVIIRNVHGEETGLVELNSEAMSSPKEFRVRLQDLGNFQWGGNERDLQALGYDVNTYVAHHSVQQIAAYGWDEASRLWFFRDTAVGENEQGEVVLIPPDECGVFWHGGIGYLLGERGKERQSYRQGPCYMHPGRTSAEVVYDGESYAAASMVSLPTGEDRAERLLLRELSERLYRAVGGLDGYLALAMICSYGAAPEVFRKHGAFPGLWIHGQTASGKTVITSLLMELFGFHRRDSGLGLKGNVTAVGLQIALEQYSDLPVWVDEYEHDGVIAENLRAIVHAAFNREEPSKFASEGIMRVIRTSLVVTGEASSGRAATRNRYAHLQVSAEQRLGTKEEQAENYQWLQRHREMFFVIGRAILRRRREFVAAFERAFAEWKASPEMRHVEERSKFVHGVAWGSFSALQSLFGTFLEAEEHGFRNALVGACTTAVQVAAASVNVNRFWSDLVAAYKNEVFGRTKAELRSYFYLRGTWVEHPPLAPTQGPWMSYRLYVNMGAVIPKLRESLRRQGLVMPLDQADLRDQMSKRPYFIVAANREGHRQRFGNGSGTAVVRCLCIDVDKHELGYRYTTDEEVAAAKREAQQEYAERDSGVWVESFGWADPRKGELFEIIERLEKQDDEGQNGN